MSVLYKRGKARIVGNLTPMIDMVFLLIVFFVLVSRIVNSEAAKMDLPQPRNAETYTLADENRVVINILPGVAGGIDGYRMAGRDYADSPAGLQAMSAELTNLYRANAAISVNLRADRRTHYEHVEEVMQMIADAAREADNAIGAARVNLVVAKDD